MDRIIAVYTGTGNSLYAAAMVEGYRPVLIEKLLSGEESLDGVQELGFAFPVYCYGVPFPMRRFIREYMGKRDNSGIKYAFALATCASSPLYALADFEAELSSAGCALSYSASVKLPDGYLPLQRKAVSEDDAYKAREEAERKMKRISDSISAYDISIPKRGILFRPIRAISKIAIKPRKEKLEVSERCISCGTCWKVCPMENIAMENGKPSFGDDCISCFACYHQCPENAIRYKKAEGQYRGFVAAKELFRR